MSSLSFGIASFSSSFARLIELAASTPWSPRRFASAPFASSLPPLPRRTVFVICQQLFCLKSAGRSGEGFNVAISPPEDLVVSGPCRLSRNPLVFGAFTA
jgi:hypothetical protein